MKRRVTSSIFCFWIYIFISFSFQICSESLSDYEEELQTIDFNERWYFWEYILKTQGSSPKIVKSHFPEMFELLSTIRKTKTINEEAFEVMTLFGNETVKSLQEIIRGNLFSDVVVQRSKPHSQLLLLGLLNWYHPRIVRREKLELLAEEGKRKPTFENVGMVMGEIASAFYEKKLKDPLYVYLAVVVGLATFSNILFAFNGTASFFDLIDSCRTGLWDAFMIDVCINVARISCGALSNELDVEFVRLLTKYNYRKFILLFMSNDLLLRVLFAFSNINSATFAFISAVIISIFYKNREGIMQKNEEDLELIPLLQNIGKLIIR